MKSHDDILERAELLNTIRALLIKYRAQSAILFGSYARNEADGGSDIDVLVIGGSAFESTDVFSLADDLHRATHKAVDVYELCEIDRESHFYQTILREWVHIAA